MTRRSGGRGGAADWSVIRAKIERANAAIASALEPPPEKAREILEARARLLAVAPAAPRPAERSLEVVVFSLADESYAVEARCVREAARLHDLAPVPGAPDFVAGVTNLRGEFLDVLDLRRVLGVPARGLTDLSRVIVLGARRAEFGILADRTQGVSLLPLEEVLELPLSVSGAGREYLRGVTRDALIVLDGDVLLKDPRLIVSQAESV